MKFRLTRYWFPAVIVLAAAVQGFGMSFAVGGRDAGLAAAPEMGAGEARDTVLYDNSSIFTKFREAADRIKADSLSSESFAADTAKVLTARDTLIAPDSLRYTDPFRYKYYVALNDSLAHVQTRDSLRAAGDSLDWPKLDSLYSADSTLRAKEAFDKWYASLDKQARKNYNFEQKMKKRQHEVDSILNVKDSLLAIRDSIRENTPRILETYALPDSLLYKRIISWNRDQYFSRMEMKQVDTSYNHYFYDYPFARKDVGATYLGIVGSATQLYDYFKRDSQEGVSFYTPYEVYSPSPQTLTQYNTKTPYTELAYWGTLFANNERAENDIHILTTQNIYPGLNFRLSYDRVGANGMLENEKVDNRTFVAAANYLGKRYTANAGYIYNKMEKNENGGVVDDYWIRDTTVGSREIAVRLNDASNLIKKNTVFLDQTYRIPFTFLERLGGKKKAMADTTGGAAEDDEEAGPTMDEILERNVTTAFIGHSSQYSVYTKRYEDQISSTDSVGRSVYDNYFINPRVSNDSLRVMKFENKVFLKLQPWAQDAIVSSLNVGVGDKMLNYYKFTPRSYIEKPSDIAWNSVYLYGGVAGRLKGFDWNATGFYTFAGDEINDFGIDANASLQFFPFRRARKSPVTFGVSFKTSLDEPEYYEQHYFSNHFRWDNDFDKKSVTKISASLDIPHWNARLSGGYALLKNNLFYDEDGIIRQNGSAMSVAKVGLMKNFRAGFLHFENEGLFQVSSDEDVMPLPSAALNLRWYGQFNIVKDVMQLQVGANATYTTKWYAPSYSPALGQFINQKATKYGDDPYIDLFVNIQWKRMCMFVKIVNVGMGWPNDKADYFSAKGYIRPQRSLKFGFFWPFYVSPQKNAKAKAGGSIGGGSESSRSSSSSGGLTGGLGGGGLIGGMRNL